VIYRALRAKWPVLVYPDAPGTASERLELVGSSREALIAHGNCGNGWMRCLRRSSSDRAKPFKSLDVWTLMNPRGRHWTIQKSRFAERLSV
jgi:hypothetical protein